MGGGSHRHIHMCAFTNLNSGGGGGGGRHMLPSPHFLHLYIEIVHLYKFQTNIIINGHFPQNHLPLVIMLTFH